MTKRLTLALLLFATACPGRSGPTETTPAPAAPTAETTPTPAPTMPGPLPQPSKSEMIAVTPEQVAEAKAKLLAKYGAAHKERIDRGVDQIAKLWRASDGDLVEFAVAQFVAEPKDRDALFDRLQKTLEQIKGHNLELGRTVRCFAMPSGSA